jgi:type II secretory pathway pseudopilin PulG
MNRHIRFASRRPAFRAIELLIVILIIVIAIGLLLPALEGFREVVPVRTSSINNLKQIGLSIQTHFEQIGYLPDAGGCDLPLNGTVGGTTSKMGQSQVGPWSVQILPFIEQRYLLQTGGANNTTSDGTVGKWDLPVRTYLDPGRGRNPVAAQGGAGLTDFALNYVIFNNDSTEAPTVTYPVRHKLTMEDITGGTSNTIAVGEKFLNIDLYKSGSGTEPDCGYGYIGVGTLRWSGSLTNCRDSLQTKAPQPSAGSFGSPYPYGVPFVFYDGSTRMINYKGNGGDLTPLLIKNRGENEKVPSFD